MTTPARDSEFRRRPHLDIYTALPPRNAIGAYDGAVHVTDRPPTHRLDLIERPSWPKPAPAAVAPLRRTAVAGEPRIVRHQIDSPARLGFGFGFGFAAGVWTFRASIALIAAATLLVGVWRLLSVALH